MRTQDRAWLGLKRAALEAVTGNAVTDQQLSGARLVATSNSAAVARIVRHRLLQLEPDDLEVGKGTPLVEAILPRLEAGHEGTLSWINRFDSCPMKPPASSGSS